MPQYEALVSIMTNTRVADHLYKEQKFLLPLYYFLIHHQCYLELTTKLNILFCGHSLFAVIYVISTVELLLSSLQCNRVFMIFHIHHI